MVLPSKQECFLSPDTDRVSNTCPIDFERSRLMDIQHPLYGKFAAVFPPYQRRNDFAVGGLFRRNTDKHFLHVFHLLR